MARSSLRTVKSSRWEISNGLNNWDNVSLQTTSKGVRTKAQSLLHVESDLIKLLPSDIGLLFDISAML